MTGCDFYQGSGAEGARGEPCGQRRTRKDGSPVGCGRSWEAHYGKPTAQPSKARTPRR